MAVYNHQAVEVAIGAPQLTSTPLPKRRPAAPGLSSLSLPPPDHVPTLSAVHPMASPAYIQPPYFHYGFFPQAMSAMYYSPGYTPCSVQSCSPPTYLDPRPPSITSVPSIPDYTRPVFYSQPPQTSEPGQSSPTAETRPMDYLHLLTCSNQKPDIGRAVDDMISKALDPAPTKTDSILDRQSALENRLRSLQQQCPAEAKELLAFLNFNCSAIEKEQQQCLSDGLFPSDYNTWLIQRYSQQLHLVFNSVERSLQLLDTQQKISHPTRKSLSTEAIRVMEKWYLQHLSNPYPTQAEADDLANLGGITHTQLRKWFANKRHRSKPHRAARVLAARYDFL